MRRENIVHVLRIGHRLVRDDRTTTHVCLVARAFGAEKIYVFDCESDVVKSIEEVNSRWGGEFEVSIVDDWRRVIRDWKTGGGAVVHLTMYGVGLDDVISEVRGSERDILVVVGAEKVPREVYGASDFNVAVGNQPHSEVAALAVFLDRFFGGEELKRRYMHAKYRIIPNRSGKRVEKISS